MKGRNMTKQSATTLVAALVFAAMLGCQKKPTNVQKPGDDKKASTEKTAKKSETAKQEKPAE
jgi:hypothetical protein